MGDRKLDRLFVRYRTKGDIGALGEVFDRSAPELMRVARHLCRDGAEAEDVVQATFLTALAKADSYDSGRSVLPWLLGILALHAREARRKAGRNPDPERVAERIQREPIDAASDSEFQSDVTRAVQGLPDTYRGVLFAHLAEGKGPREVAEQFGLSPVAARVRLHRGLKLLRAALPPGYAIGTAVVLTPERGLAAVRAEVVSAGAKAAGVPLATGAGATASIGAAARLGLGAKLGLAASGLFAVAAGLLMSRADGPAVDRASEEEVESVSQLESQTRQTQEEIELARLAGEGGASRPGTEQTSRVSRSPLVTVATETVRGRVVDADTGEPLAGALVRLWAPGSRPDARPFARTTTDAAGRFVVREAPQKGALMITAQGFAGWRGLSRGVQAPLEEGQDPVVELGELALPRGDRLHGLVLDAHGEPVEAAAILFSAPFLDWYGQPEVLQALATSDSSGAWRAQAALPYSATRYAKLPGLDPGECRFRLVAASRLGVGTREALVREAAGGDEGRALSATAIEGENSDGVIQLAPSRALDVFVVDAGGQPVPEARVWIEPRVLQAFYVERSGASVPGLHPALARLFKTRSDHRGRARFAAVPSGERRGSPWRRMTLFATGPDGSLVSQPLDVAERAEGSVTLTLGGPPRRLLRGEVVDANEEPIAHARLRLGEHYEFEADDAGLFEAWIDGEITEDERVLVVEADGFELYESLVGGQDFESAIAIRLEPATPLAELPPLRGLVRRADGALVGAVEVVLDDGRRSRSVWTDEDGHFELERLGDGEHRLSVMTQPKTGTWADPLLVPADLEFVELEMQSLELQPTRMIAQVLHARSMQSFDPDRAALLSLDDGRRAPIDLILGVGHVRAEQLPVGRWRLWVGRLGAGVGTVDLDVAPGQTNIETRVVLDPAGSVEGRLRTAPGTDQHPELWAERIDAEIPGELGAEGWAGYVSRTKVEVGEDGRFEAEQLLPGEYLLLAGPEGAAGRERIEVESSRTTRLAFTARPTARVHFVFDERPARGGLRLVVTHESGDEFVLPYRSAASLRGFEESAASPVPFAAELGIDLPLGDLDWRLEFPANDFDDSRSQVREPLHGHLRLESIGAEWVRVDA